MRKRIVVVVFTVFLVASAYAQTKNFSDLVKTGTPESVQAAIDKGVDVNARDESGYTPLIYAAIYNKNLDVFTTLLKAGADVNANDVAGQTVLMFAAMWNQKVDIINILLKAGAKVNAKDSDGLTPLMNAAMHNENLDVITTLLKAGADVNAKSKDGTTPLMCVRDNPNPDVFDTLLSAGADAKATDDEGKTAFDYMRENMKETDIFGTLQGSQQNQTTKPQAQTAEQQKAQKQRDEQVKAQAPIRAGDFSVKINSWTLADRVLTGNEFLDVPPESGIIYLIIDVTFKNMANEPKRLFDGTLIVKDGKQIYKFDHSETIMAKGWGILLDSINPLVSMTTKLVYKLSTEMKGTVYWQPTGANAGNQFILGDLAF